ncbi:MAG: hypothetical protein GXY19_11685 [Phycisphaerae bacterium]|nr:hypothetical protein [Phycisphaerae bacterium]
MLNDRRVIWILEYVSGGALVVVPLTSRVVRLPVWTDAYTWATQLFVVGLGVVLISCASSMRQRLLLARRIDALAMQMIQSGRSSSPARP